MTIFLVALMATSGSGLALTAMIEATLGRWSADSLQHELAVDSLVAGLPMFLQDAVVLDTDGPFSGQVRQLEFGFGEIKLLVRTMSEKDKAHLGSMQGADAIQRTLSALAKRYGLDEKSIRVRAVVERDDTPIEAGVYWFDQVIEPVRFEQVFRWRLTHSDDTREGVAVVWSDVITFWNGAAGELLGMEVQTAVGSDVRRWYLVARISGGQAQVLCRRRL